MNKTFEELGLSSETLAVLRHRGFEEPTPIQSLTIPEVLTGNHDIVGQAQTGTGKTAAFGLPLLEHLTPKAGFVQALVLTPTRELAVQVSEEIQSFRGKRRFTILPVYGGQSMGLQLQHLRRGVDIVVGTPGRVLDHLRRKTLRLDRIAFMVLDEADEMLNMGFLEDVREIMEQTNSGKRTLLFSATMPREILEIAQQHMGEYEVLRTGGGRLTLEKTDQIYFEVRAADKFEALCRIIDIEEDFYGLVFCRTKVDVDTIAKHLVERGYDADGLHGDLSQIQREKILHKFKKRHITILVATDVAARGIDVQDLTHVINFALPQDPESYIHRIGRTGRAGKEGSAITFITPAEYRKLQVISRRAKTDIRKGRLPRVKDVIKTKRGRIRADVEAAVEAGPGTAYFNLAKELLSHNDPTVVLAALLQHSFSDELDENRYVEIEPLTVDRQGKARLFITEGRAHGMTPKKLVRFIQGHSKVDAAQIRDVEIHEKFSFVSLPFHEAERLLVEFKNRKRGKGPRVSKARPMGTQKSFSKRRKPSRPFGP